MFSEWGGQCCSRSLTLIPLDFIAPKCLISCVYFSFMLYHCPFFGARYFMQDITVILDLWTSAPSEAWILAGKSHYFTWWLPETNCGKLLIFLHRHQWYLLLMQTFICFLFSIWRQILQRKEHVLCFHCTYPQYLISHLTHLNVLCDYWLTRPPFFNVHGSPIESGINTVICLTSHCLRWYVHQQSKSNPCVYVCF